MHGSAKRVDNREQQLDSLRKRWLDREQKLITMNQEAKWEQDIIT